MQVRRIFDLYLHGNGSGPLPYRAIVELLSKEGISSPGMAKKNPNKKRAAHLWSIPPISRIIWNPVYKGLAQFGKRGTYKKGEKQVVRPDSELIVYTVPLIISEATWAQAQARGEANKRLAERNSNPNI